MAAIRDRGNGSYQMIVYYGGKQRTKTYHHPSGQSGDEQKKDALTMAEKWEKSLKNGDNYNPAMTLGELADKFWEYSEKENKEITTYTYMGQYNNHIAPYFARMNAVEITRDRVNNHIDFLSGSLSHGSRKKVINVLGAIYTFGIKKGYVKENTCRNIVNPRDNREEKQYTMDKAQAKRFLQFIAESDANDDVRRLITFLCYTGLRISECLALSWADVDFDEGLLRVRQTLTNANGLHTTPPKTKKSRRSIGFGENVARILKEQKEYTNILRGYLGENMKHPELVFPSSRGGYRDRHSVYVSLKRLTDGTEFDFLTLHKLRHVFATILLNEKCDIAVVSAILGHSSISVTADIYAEVLEESKIESAKKIENALKIQK